MHGNNAMRRAVKNEFAASYTMTDSYFDSYIINSPIELTVVSFKALLISALLILLHIIIVFIASRLLIICTL